MSRCQFTLDEKIHTIDRPKNDGQSRKLYTIPLEHNRLTAIAKELSTLESTISNVRSRRNPLKTMCETKPKKGRWCTAQHRDLEEELLEWFDRQRFSKEPIRDSMLKAKTELVAEKLKIENFKCSASWILRFRQRYNVGFGQMSGESTAMCSKIHDDVWPSGIGNRDDKVC
ncbi:tigger transposable element-derived protein 4-like [Aphis gossypii]|uniref:tigger transposable element-derived protein 4-like n=1 Tax=Aphis gossypii TaxID=80765 RepID=UPI00215911D5|nr:tigger transposable element-derived protein 4-like [Aphis gossypii]